MFVIGLTGSLAMGKSTTAQFFRDAGVPVHDADATVHRLYAGAAVAPIEAAFPGSAVDGRIDRARLAARVLDDPAALKRLEAIVHPMVREAEIAFLREAEARGEKIVVLDIPLLLETGGDRRVDAVVVVSAPREVQRARVLERPGMSQDKLDALLARQMADAEKRRRADFVVPTGLDRREAFRRLKAIVESVRRKPPSRPRDGSRG